MMPRCERCEESESIIECRDCEKAGPIKLCAECSGIIHCKGKGAKHVLYSLDTQEKRVLAEERQKEIEAVSVQLDKRKLEIQEYRKQLHEAVAVSERNVRKTITDVQRKLKLKAKDLMDQIKAEVTRRDQVLMQAMEHWDELQSTLKQDETSIATLLAKDETQFSEDMGAVMKETNHQIEVHMLPSMELTFRLDYTGIMAAMNTLSVTFPPNDTDVLEESLEPFDSIDEGLESLCYITSLMSRDGSFWLLPEISEETYLNLLHMSNRIRKMYIDDVNLRTLGESNEPPEEGSKVFCRHQADRRWYRGRIEESSGMPKSALVRWLDYGKTDRVALGDILPAPEDMFKDIRPWAIEATVFSELMTSKNVPQDTRWFFGDLTKEQTLRCTFSSQIECPNGRIVYQVSLQREEENGGVTDISSLVAAKMESSSASKSTLASRDIRLDMDPTIERTSLILNATAVSPPAEVQANDAKPMEVDSEPASDKVSEPQSTHVSDDKTESKKAAEVLPEQQRGDLKPDLRDNEAETQSNLNGASVQNGYDSHVQLESSEEQAVYPVIGKEQETVLDAPVLNGSVQTVGPEEKDQVVEAHSCHAHQHDTMPGASCSPNTHLVDAFQQDEISSSHVEVNDSGPTENGVLMDYQNNRGEEETMVEGAPAEMHVSLGSDSDEFSFTDAGCDGDRNHVPYMRMPTIETNNSSSPENSYKDSSDVNMPAQTSASQSVVSEVDTPNEVTYVTCKTDSANVLVTNQASHIVPMQTDEEGELEEKTVSSECDQNSTYCANAEIVEVQEKEVAQVSDSDLPIPSECDNAAKVDAGSSQSDAYCATHLASETKESWISSIPPSDKAVPSDPSGGLYLSSMSEPSNDSREIEDNVLENVAAQIVSEAVSQSVEETMDGTTHTTAEKNIVEIVVPNLLTEEKELKSWDTDISWTEKAHDIKAAYTEASQSSNLQTFSEQGQLSHQESASKVSRDVSSNWESKPPRILRRQTPENAQVAETKEINSSVPKGQGDQNQSENEVHVHIAETDLKGSTSESQEAAKPSVHRPIRRNRPNLTSETLGATLDVDNAGGDGTNVVPTHRVASPKREPSGIADTVSSPKRDQSDLVSKGNSPRKGKGKEKGTKTASVSVQSEEDTRALNDSLERTAKNLPEANIHVAGATFRGYVKGEFSSGGSFWMELARSEEQEKGLQHIKQAVNNLPNFAFLQCESHNDTKQLLVVKTGVNEYRRARFAGQIMTSANTRSKVVVCMLDEGRYEEVPTANVFKLLNKPVFDYPQQTVRCSIAIDRDHTFSPDAVKCFEELTAEKLLEATVVEQRDEMTVVTLRETDAAGQQDITSLIYRKFPERRTRTPPSDVSRTPTPPDTLQGRPTMTYSQPAVMTTMERPHAPPSPALHQQRWGMGVAPQPYYGVPVTGPPVVPGMVQVNSQWVAAPSGATAGAGAPEARAVHTGFGQPQRTGGSFVIDNWNEGPGQNEHSERREPRYNRRERDRFGERRDGSRGSPHRDGGFGGSYRGHRDGGRDRPRDTVCFNCNEVGHYQRECPKAKSICLQQQQSSRPPRVRRERIERGGRKSERRHGSTSEASHGQQLPEPEEEVWP